MLRAITAATSTASAAPIPVRGAQAAAASAQAGSRPGPATAIETSAPQTSLAVPPQVFRFNSTEFIYRPDIGRIILIGQSPVTGERKIQIPSEEALRAYERTIRAEEQRSLLERHLQPEPSPVPAADPAPVPVTPTVANLPQALSAALSDGEGSGLVSISA